MSAIRFALVGAGNIAKIYVAAFAAIPDAVITVVCNRTEATGRALAEQCGAAWVADFHDAVRRDDVDAVVVATPSGTHADVAVAAAQAGKHLLVEKPLDITLARVDSILQAAEQAGVVLASVYPLRFTEGAQRAKVAMDAGRLGQLALADVYVKWFRPQSYYDTSWRGTWKSDGGGALMNQAIHNIDLVQWLAGPVVTVIGRTATLAHKMETEDTASALLSYANGAQGVIQGATSCWPGDPARVELHGDRGTIVLQEGRIVVWKLQDAAPGEEEAMLALESADGSGAADPMAIGFEKHRRQIVDLIEAIRTGRPPAIQGAEARRSVEIVRAVYRSAATNAPVALPLTDDR
ncbi:MAG: Gfo/Idh/MocA family oxidoreductase [Caldilineaceae bacterium]|nr:Gfo/Idh/MocA family oxidoreductase [Caldilineaceae bacterium]